MFRTLLLTVTCFTLIASPLQAKDIHVSPTGDDRNPGTRTKPIRSLDIALSRTANTSKSTIWLASGTYQRSTRGRSLQEVGFIHLSQAHQVEASDQSS